MCDVPADVETPDVVTARLDLVRSRLQSQTGLLHGWANERSEPRYTHILRDAPVGRFGTRIKMVSDKGLFLGGGQPGQDPILPMQARLAYGIHQLHYVARQDKQGRYTQGRWLPAQSSPTEFPRRSNGYLIRLWQNNAKYPPPPSVILQQSIPKVDMALIAHCFQTPIEIREAWDDDFFEFWLERLDWSGRHEPGKDLFSYRAVDYLLDCAVDTNDIGHFAVPPQSGTRSAIVEVIQLPKIPAEVYLGFTMKLPPKNLPAGFQNAEVMLFEYDHKTTRLSLISTHGNTAGDLLYDTEFRVPRVVDLDGGIRVSTGIRFGESAKSELLMLLIRPGALDRRLHGVSSLAQLGVYTASAHQTARPLLANEVETLRRLLFRLPRNQWCLLKKTVEITPGGG